MDWILQNVPWIVSKIWKHRLAIGAALFAIAVSFLQAVNAFRKAHKHKKRSGY